MKIGDTVTWNITLRGNKTEPRVGKIVAIGDNVVVVKGKRSTYTLGKERVQIVPSD